jgi:spore coat protein JC
MFVYEKKLQYPVKVATPNPKLAAVIISQYGGPDGELGASLRYLSQRYSMPYPELKGLLTDIGTEELGHLEMIGTLVHQLTRNLTEEQIKTAGFDAYFVDHTTGVFPQFASGYPWSAATMQVTGDTIADLTEDLAAEQKARVTYDNILRLSDDPDVNDAIKFLREREVVHFQRFGETKRTRWNKMKRTADIKDIQDQNFSDILYYLIRYACRIEFMQSVFAAITKITQGLIVHAFLFTFHFC